MQPLLKPPSFPDQYSKYKTFWRRTFAAAFDGAVFFLVASAALPFVSMVDGPIAYLLWLVVAMIISFGYSIFTTYAFRGTLGKLLFNLQVDRAWSSDRISLFQAFERELLNILASIGNFVLVWILLAEQGPAGVILLMNGKSTAAYAKLSEYLSYVLIAAELITCLFSQRRRAIHDLIAGTVVSKTGRARWYSAIVTVAAIVGSMIIYLRLYALLKAAVARF